MRENGVGPAIAGKRCEARKTSPNHHGLPSNATPDPRSNRHSANAGRYTLAVRGDDLYETPPEAVRALLKIEQLPEFVWETACGPGSIVQALREAGHRVCATDLVDRGCPDSQARVDFLLERALPDPSIDAIVTNPPFKLADEFVAHALTLCPRAWPCCCGWHFWKAGGGLESSTAVHWREFMYSRTDCR